jgi:hypothetical protein
VFIVAVRSMMWDDAPMHEPWEPLSVDAVRLRFEPFDVDWWVAGGRAIDLFLGWESRAHEDIDIEMFRTDRDVLFDVFEGWELYFVSESRLHRWGRGQDVGDGVFGVWGRPSPDAPWAVEIMLADGDSATWKFRRDNSIIYPRTELTAQDPEGVRYCVPEVQLLFKAKKHRAKDDLDMVRCLHRLDRSQRAWLGESIRRSEPSHPWLELIRQAEIGGAE